MEREGGYMFFDAHADVLDHIRLRRAQGETEVFRKYHYDKYLKSGIDSSIFAIWLETPFKTTALEAFEEMAEAAKLEFMENKDIILQAKSFEDLKKAKEEKKLGILLGSEGLVHIGKDLDYIYYMYEELGIRQASLTWNEANDLATGVSGDESRGLTQLGKRAIRIMEDLGIIVDVSHLNEKSFWEVLEIANKPVIASHSNAYSVCPAKRNLKDEQIIALSKMGGVMGMNAYHAFVSNEEEKKTAKGLAEHVVKIVDLVGIDFVGCGFDFLDFYEEASPGLKDLNGADQANNFLIELEKAGFNKEELEQIKYKSFMRVIEEILK